MNYQGETHLPLLGLSLGTLLVVVIDPLDCHDNGV